MVDFSKHFNTNKILELQSLSHAIDSVNTAVEHALDQIAPLKEAISTWSNTQPYFDNDIKAQHHTIHRREWLWKKYKLDKIWKAYQCERNHCVTMLKYKKWHHICTKIRSKKNDIKNLYKLVNHLTGNEVQNRLLNCESDKELANRFANYFIEKNRQNKSKVQ